MEMEEPVGAPRPDADNHGRWTNRGEAIYRETFGDKMWQEQCSSQFLAPFPDASFRSRARLRLGVSEAQALFMMMAARTGFRATHMAGTGATGQIRMRDQFDLPENDFLVPGRTFDCRIRHANASFIDDRHAVVRSCALKFANTDFDSPLDIIMNSGPISAFWCYWSFMLFARARQQSSADKWDPQKEWLRLLPAALIGSIESVRLAPSCYSNVSYYSKAAFRFYAHDGVERYLKWRLRRPDLELESGLLPPHAQMSVWDNRGDPADDRAPNYLRKGFRDTVHKNGVTYELAVQIRPYDRDKDSIEFFNNMRVWDHEKYPYHPVADVVLDEALSDDDLEKTRFWLGHQPSALAIPEAMHIRDYRSMSWVRTRVYRKSHFGRWLYRSILGKPKDFAEKDRIPLPGLPNPQSTETEAHKEEV